MARPVVVPLDRSEFAEAAIPRAVHAARRLAAPLHLVLVHQPQTVPMTADSSADLQAQIDAGLLEAGDLHLRRMAHRIAAESHLLVEPHLLTGHVAETLAEHVETHRARLIVMSTHGRGGLSRLFLGSVADRLLRIVHQPILLQRPDTHQATSPVGRGRRILVPLDGSPLAERTLGEVLSVFGTEHPTLILAQVVAMPATIHVLAGHDTIAGPDLQQLVDAAGRYLAQVADRLRADGHQVESVVLGGDHAAQGLLAWAEEHEPDLIAIATRGQGGVGRAVFGSVADKLIRSAACPVLAWNPPEVRG
ncbi:MAG: universal stress protein [Gemmatimonadales bacterium]